jgi:hypothetical protein
VIIVVKVFIDFTIVFVTMMRPKSLNHFGGSMTLTRIDDHTALNLAAIASIKFSGTDDDEFAANVNFFG